MKQNEKQHLAEIKQLSDDMGKLRTQLESAQVSLFLWLTLKIYRGHD